MTRYLLICLAVLVLCSGAAAQTATGVIQGHVYDASGGAVPDAAGPIPRLG